MIQRFLGYMGFWREKRAEDAPRLLVSRVIFSNRSAVARGPMPPKMPMVFFVLLILDTSIL